MRQMQLYLHIPFCMKKCLYCDFLSFAEDEKTQDAYMNALMREIRYYGEREKDVLISTVYIGGGTPSWLKADRIMALMQAVRGSFALMTDAEITIECNPGTVTEEKLAAYRAAGINRLSIGLQSADDAELRLLGRVHTFAQFIKTYELARGSGFTNINVDLMSGLPGQTVRAVRATLQKVLMLRPEHISAYSLIVEEGTPFYDRYHADVQRQQAGLATELLPTEDEAYEMAKATERMLSKAGYEHYEISNFAKPGYACRHNIGYWRRAEYLGLGLGAASLLGEYRCANRRDLAEYLRLSRQIDILALRQENGEQCPASNLHATVEKLSVKAQMEEFMFLGLRLTEGVYREDFERFFQIPVESVYGEPLKRMAAAGLLVKREGRIYLTGRGRDVSNYVLAQFLLEETKTG